MSTQLDAYAPDEILGKAYDARLMGRLVDYLEPYRGQVVVARAALLLLSITAVAPAIMVKFVIDHSITPVDRGNDLSRRRVQAPCRSASRSFFVLMAPALLRYGQNVLVTSVGQRAMRDLRAELFGHLERLSLSFFE